MILADTITPLMGLHGLELLGVNLLIAGLEAWVIQRWFKPRRAARRTFGIMVLSNYWSALVGTAGKGSFRGPFGTVVQWWAGEKALYVLPWVLAAVFAAACGATLLAEWPFCFWAVGPRTRRFAASVKAAVASQTISYLALLPLMFMVSSLTLATSIRADPAVVSQAADIATIYYLSNDDGSLWKVRVNGSGREKVKTLNYQGNGSGSQPRLFVARWPEEASWNLRVGNSPVDIVLGDVTRDGAVTWRVGLEGQEHEAGPCLGFGRAAIPMVGPKPAWVIDFRPWRGSLSASNSKTGQYVSASLNTPFVIWRPNNPSLLPGDLLVYELEGQIVLLDLNRKRIGLIVVGRQPVVVLDEDVAQRLAAQSGPASRPEVP